MFTWAVVGTLVLGAPLPKDERKPVDPPAGTWRLERLVWDAVDFTYTLELEGEGKTTTEFTPKSQRTRVKKFAKTREIPAAFYARGEVLEADLGKLVEFEVEGERFTVHPIKAIWKVEADTLTVCLGPRDGKTRPTKFTAPKGSDYTLMIYKRIKD